jgi:geranylgeranyl reductase family protein
MPPEFDVIISGLGPAGAAAAMELGRSGAKVLALSGNRRRPKPCGGCLSARTAAWFDWLDPPNWLRRHPVTKLWLLAPGRPPGLFQTNEPGAYYVDREKLDRFLARRAAQSGAQVLATRLEDFTQGPQGVTVQTQAGKFRGDWLLGADGAASLVRRRLGLGQNGFVYAAMMEERPAPPRLLELLQQSALIELGGFKSGYGWAFLRGENLNLGMIERPSGGGTVSGRPVVRLRKFLRRLGMGGEGQWRSAVIPCGNGDAPMTSKRTALLGDAAGLADPFLAEGIGQALVSGRWAAQAIMAGNLSWYQAQVRRHLRREHLHAKLLARLVYRWPGVFQGIAYKHPHYVKLGWAMMRGNLAYRELWPKLLRTWLRRRLGER